ncbi:LLM class flavin-dependent oxidoreductase [Streptomyces sp. BK205]|uniref:LLM class flavin-dependent oxidoreductase n=1 Tax=Streptomyces sp. BK205 TaxID=2512164 RepID=UPI00104B61C8|nr:LLM class flavin-dependent oxidoreductase [Streptomyces sp. BK205]TCR16054.1 alkanesulfonate monooxygenase SsuD/methylene tetrahydromethanopterin reductase-like flavin-dependent oxidoreductase (luciferase family) [Streptomyces sp. BK205]
MDFGMFFEFQLPRPWAVEDEQTLFQNALEWAELGEQAGIGYAWAQEHHFLEEYSHSSAPEVFLAAVSQRTRTMRLGHGVNLMPPAYNHPARVAERIATLDLVSNGRVEWGTGESSSRLEMEGFGVNYLEKRAMWAEATRECTRMLAAQPYPGFSGEYFSMPARNIVPKPVQRPHPPMWLACTSRETVKLAARLGLGALTFSFMDGDEAAFWVKEYYDTFRTECRPIGQVVNPNIAMLAGVMIDEDEDEAVRRGLLGQQFFKWALAYYFRFGTHVPGGSELWNEFRKADVEPMAGIAAVGSPRRVREHLLQLEKAGVDQVIMLQQAGNYKHEHICQSLSLLGSQVLPEFLDRNEERKRAKREELAPYIEKAMEHVVPVEAARPEPVEAYPVLWKRLGVDAEQWGARRSLDAAQTWRLNVGGGQV